MMKYEWRNGRSHAADAQAVGEELADISKTTGTLTPSDVVDRARDEASALHPCFEWDDSKAAEHHRRAQARMVVRAVVVVPQKKSPAKPMFVHTSSDDAGPHYIASSVIVERPDLLDMAKKHAATQLRSAKQRIEELQSLSGLSEHDEARTLVEQAEKKL